ncbi:MAG TPA: tail fiber protein [Pyrinomonadaceae bacterium]|jgi:microcystin-dependent protein
MGTPFMSEIRIMAFNFAPQGWAQCNGQFLPINQNQALFSLLGTTFGGNGQTTFALPDLRGRIPVHTGPGFNLGQSGGQEFHTLTQSEMAAHTHILQGTNNASTTDNPDGTVVLGKASINMYGGATNLTPMDATVIGNFGGSQAHENRQPFLTLNFCIALQGAFPSRN